MNGEAVPGGHTAAVFQAASRLPSRPPFDLTSQRRDVGTQGFCWGLRGMLEGC
jgi:hypothetical protein